MNEKYDEEFIENLFWGDGKEYREVTSSEITGNSRWSTFYSQVFQKNDGTYWEACWSRGSTEYQDNGIEDFEFYEVVPEEITTTIYLKKNATEVVATPAPAPAPPATGQLSPGVSIVEHDG